MTDIYPLYAESAIADAPPLGEISLSVRVVLSDPEHLYNRDHAPGARGRRRDPAPARPGPGPGPGPRPEGDCGGRPGREEVAARVGAAAAASSDARANRVWVRGLGRREDLLC